MALSPLTRMLMNDGSSDTPSSSSASMSLSPAIRIKSAALFREGKTPEEISKTVGVPVELLKPHLATLTSPADSAPSARPSRPVGAPVTSRGTRVPLTYPAKAVDPTTLPQIVRDRAATGTEATIAKPVEPVRTGGMAPGNKSGERVSGVRQTGSGMTEQQAAESLAGDIMKGDIRIKGVRKPDSPAAFISHTQGNERWAQHEANTAKRLDESVLRGAEPVQHGQSPTVKPRETFSVGSASVPTTADHARVVIKHIAPLFESTGSRSSFLRDYEANTTGKNLTAPQDPFIAGIARTYNANPQARQALSTTLQAYGRYLSIVSKQHELGLSDKDVADLHQKVVSSINQIGENAGMNPQMATKLANGFKTAFDKGRWGAHGIGVSNKDWQQMVSDYESGTTKDNPHEADWRTSSNAHVPRALTKVALHDATKTVVDQIIKQNFAITNQKGLRADRAEKFGAQHANVQAVASFANALMGRPELPLNVSIDRQLGDFVNDPHVQSTLATPEGVARWATALGQRRSGLSTITDANGRKSPELDKALAAHTKIPEQVAKMMRFNWFGINNTTNDPNHPQALAFRGALTEATHELHQDKPNWNKIHALLTPYMTKGQSRLFFPSRDIEPTPDLVYGNAPTEEEWMAKNKRTEPLSKEELESLQKKGEIGRPISAGRRSDLETKGYSVESGHQHYARNAFAAATGMDYNRETGTLSGSAGRTGQQILLEIAKNNPTLYKEIVDRVSRNTRSKVDLNNPGSIPSEWIWNNLLPHNASGNRIVATGTKLTDKAYPLQIEGGKSVSGLPIRPGRIDMIGKPKGTVSKYTQVPPDAQPEMPDVLPAGKRLADMPQKLSDPESYDQIGNAPGRAADLFKKAVDASPTMRQITREGSVPTSVSGKFAVTDIDALKMIMAQNRDTYPKATPLERRDVNEMIQLRRAFGVSPHEIGHVQPNAKGNAAQAKLAAILGNEVSRKSWERFTALEEKASRAFTNVDTHEHINGRNVIPEGIGLPGGSAKSGMNLNNYIQQLENQRTDNGKFKEGKDITHEQGVIDYLKSLRTHVNGNPATKTGTLEGTLQWLRENINKPHNLAGLTPTTIPGQIRPHGMTDQNVRAVGARLAKAIRDGGQADIISKYQLDESHGNVGQFILKIISRGDADQVRRLITDVNKSQQAASSHVRGSSRQGGHTDPTFESVANGNVATGANKRILGAENGYQGESHRTGDRVPSPFPSEDVHHPFMMDKTPNEWGSVIKGIEIQARHDPTLMRSVGLSAADIPLIDEARKKILGGTTPEQLMSAINPVKDKNGRLLHDETPDKFKKIFTLFGKMGAPIEVPSAKSVKPPMPTVDMPDAMPGRGRAGKPGRMKGLGPAGAIIPGLIAGGSYAEQAARGGK